MHRGVLYIPSLDRPARDVSALAIIPEITVANLRRFLDYMILTVRYHAQRTEMWILSKIRQDTFWQAFIRSIVS